MKTITTVHADVFKTTRSWFARLLLFFVGIDTIEKSEWMLECWTDEGEVRQQEVLTAPSACGFSLIDMLAVPVRESSRIRQSPNSWKAKIVGADKDKLQTVYRYLVSKKWVPIAVPRPIREKADETAKQMLD